MSIGEIRERARLMKESADSHIDDGAKKLDQRVLDTAWKELLVLCTDASHTLGTGACISIPTERKFKNWSTIRFYADGIVASCDLKEPPPPHEVPGDYGA